MSPASRLCAEDDPVGDDITPDTASGTCPCGAETTVLTAADGTTGTFTAHHAVIAALFPAES
ncbi:hypothetical protein ABT202_25980 [Streptomyces sp900105245]|uniref:hypothetical protein n=1 Tax=Streptomyces sp. 900105245 TaxID=3154379 RepID=UPI00331650A4